MLLIRSSTKIAQLALHCWSKLATRAKKGFSQDLIHWSRFRIITKMSQCMRIPTMWYVRPAKPQISLRIRAVWSEPLLVAWIFFDTSATDWTSFGVSMPKRRLHRLVWVYTCQKCHIVGNHMSWLKCFWWICSNKMLNKIASRAKKSGELSRATCDEWPSCLIISSCVRYILVIWPLMKPADPGLLWFQTNILLVFILLVIFCLLYS